MQVFKFVPGNTHFAEFSVPDLKLSIVPAPTKARLKGPNAASYEVEQVELNLCYLLSDTVLRTGPIYKLVICMFLTTLLLVDTIDTGFSLVDLNET